MSLADAIATMREQIDALLAENEVLQRRCVNIKAEAVREVQSWAKAAIEVAEDAAKENHERAAVAEAGAEALQREDAKLRIAFDITDPEVTTRDAIGELVSDLRFQLATAEHERDMWKTSATTKSFKGNPAALKAFVDGVEQQAPTPGLEAETLRVGNDVSIADLRRIVSSAMHDEIKLLKGEREGLRHAAEWNGNGWRSETERAQRIADRLTDVHALWFEDKISRLDAERAIAKVLERVDVALRFAEAWRNGGGGPNETKLAIESIRKVVEDKLTPKKIAEIKADALAVEEFRTRNGLQEGLKET
jgi:hypothetical protein